MGYLYTIDSVYGLLRGKEIQIGRTTVYRGLSGCRRRLGAKVPSVDGAPALYRFIRDEERKNYGKLVVSGMWHTIPLAVWMYRYFMGMCWMNKDLNRSEPDDLYGIVTAAGA